MIYESEITKKYGVRVVRIGSDGMWCCERQIKGGVYVTRDETPLGSLVKSLDNLIETLLLPDETEKLCETCESFYCGWCTNKDRIEEFRLRGIYPPIRVHPTFSCERHKEATL